MQKSSTTNFQATQVNKGEESQDYQNPDEKVVTR